MHADNNPFKTPEAMVADLVPNSGDFIPEGRQVPAGNGIEWLSQGWELFRRAPGAWIGLSVVWLILLVVLGLIPLVNILLNLLLPVFTGGIMLGCKALDDGDELRIGHLFAGFSSHFGQLALVGVIYLAGVLAIGVVMALVGGGLGFAAAATGNFSVGAILLPALLIGLLFVPLAMAVWYAPALVVFQQQPPFEAMKASFFIGIKNFLPFLVYSLVVVVLAVLASLPLFLGWLVLLPVLQGSVYAGYKDMFTRN